MPVRGVQGRCGWPADVVGVAGGIFVLVGGAGGGNVEVGEGGDVGVEGVGVVDVEVASVDFVHPEAAVEVCQGRDAGAYPSWSESIFAGLLGTIICVVDHDFVFVRVAKEDISNHVWGVAVNDLIEQVRWVRERIRTIPACKDMTKNPDAFTSIFCSLQLRDQESLHS